jgi:outer membrane protein assembly factor BamB
MLAVALTAGTVIVGAAPALAAGPVVSSFSPTSGAIGTKVTIKGSGFSGAYAVTFGNPSAITLATIKSDTTITATVPATASTGPVSVLTPATQGSSTAKFTVDPSLALSAAGGHPAGTVTVSGAGFKAFEAVDVYFDTTDEALAVTNGTGNFSSVSIAVPAAAAPGTHWIAAVGRHSGSAAQSAYTVGTNWPEFGYSAKHKAANPYENVLSPSNVAGIDEDWSFTTGGAVESSSAVVNGVAYVGSNDGNVYALDAATGAQAWSFATGGAVISSPAVANGVVYVGSYDHKVYALNAATGAELWSFATGGIVTSSPAVANGMVYVGSEDGKVYALIANNGAEAWSFTTDGRVDSSPAVANGVVYADTDGGSVYALSAAAGTKLWNYTNISFPFSSSPTVADGAVYVGSADGNLYAFSATGGAKLWSFATGGIVSSSPAVSNGMAYVGSEDGQVYALNASTGAQAWSVATGGAVITAPAVANGVVYIGSADAKVHAFSAASGAELWSFTTGGAVYSSPAVANGVVYVGSSDGNLYAFDLAGGAASAARPMISELHPNYALHPRATTRARAT